MKIQPITTQPKFNGKVVFDNGTTKNITGMFPNVLHRKLDEVAMLVQDKPYNVFIFQNKQNPKFYNIAANKSLKDAQNVIGYTVKINAIAPNPYTGQYGPNKTPLFLKPHL